MVWAFRTGFESIRRFFSAASAEQKQKGDIATNQYVEALYHPLTRRMLLPLETVRAFVPIFPDPGEIRAPMKQIFNNKGGALFRGTNPVLTIESFPDLDPDRGTAHTGTFEMRYEADDMTAPPIKLSGNTYRGPQGTVVEFNPSLRAAQASRGTSEFLTRTDLRIIGEAFSPKP
ncbi:MAG: hypothetical protein H6862_02995 [Rhodospirillales bacterium]|nr:hypothetical protein [Rhodospirillales bacterium]